MHMNIGLFYAVTTGIATETFSLANALHAFGLFKVARYENRLYFALNYFYFFFLFSHFY